MLLKRLTGFVILFLLGAGVFFLPIRIHDALRLRYFIGLWFFAEAAFLLAQGESRMTPLHQLVWRYTTWRDRIVSGTALAAFFSSLYLFVWLIMENTFSWSLKVILAISAVLTTWLIYYGICALFGTDELREGSLPNLIKQWIGKRNGRS